MTNDCQSTGTMFWKVGSSMKRGVWSVSGMGRMKLHTEKGLFGSKGVTRQPLMYFAEYRKAIYFTQLLNKRVHWKSIIKIYF